MNNLYDNISAIKIWKPIVSHTKLYHANRLMYDRLKKDCNGLTKNERKQIT